MQNLRRIVVALAVPTVAVAAIAFTASTALSSSTAVPAAATEEPGTAPQNQPKQLNPNDKLLTQRTLYTLFTQRTRTSGGATSTTPPTTTASPTRSGSPTATPSATPGGPGVAPNAPASNCAEKQAQPPTTVNLGTVNNRQVLVDGAGCTLYVFTKDTTTTTACDQGCEGTWPPYAGPANAGTGVQAPQLAIFARPSAYVQATYFGKQLYRYSGDKAPGQANGQGLEQSWYMVDPAGNPITQ